MTNGGDCTSNRQRFLGAAVPACALTCLGLKGLLVFSGVEDQTLASAERPNPNQPLKHVFDEELPRKLTYREVSRMTYSSLIPLILLLNRTLGRARTRSAGVRRPLFLPEVHSRRPRGLRIVPRAFEMAADRFRSRPHRW